jgi:hypothetical protein
MHTVPILSIILVLVVIGAALWAINRYIPMQSGIRTILNIAVVVIVVVWLLKLFGLMSITL